ncbi:hypothetical protein BDN72DRAFT_848024 [Pluteus cervinus]|uniref:Uncharacterized protein n=1 Tax=Pluteus cervinus TaxID=181527 RepID=A0ACD3ABJ2_9AGAR|nr:hypothetical protein BDN72DRAFT_848024 [Pluteus cervinus]
MTMEEKLGLVIGTGQLNSNRRCIGDTYAIPRLGIPSFCLNDGPAGLRLTKGVTGFPSGINTAATFSKRLMHERGKALGEEWRGKGVHVYLGPAVDIMRNPKAGRAWESFGPDPYLNGEGAYHTITGVQSVGVQACIKHLIANNQEHWRYGLSANLDDRTLREIYWYPFERGLEADVAIVMCGYNRVNGTSSCEHPELIGDQGILRKAGFRGYVMSDWGATHGNAALVANSGLDMEQPGDFLIIGGGTYRDGRLKRAVDKEEVTGARLDEMVTRVLASWFKLGQDMGYPPVNFDVQKPDGSGPRNENVNVRTEGHVNLAKEIASASAVLLKNERVGYPEFEGYSDLGVEGYGDLGFEGAAEQGADSFKSTWSSWGGQWVFAENSEGERQGRPAGSERGPAPQNLRDQEHGNQGCGDQVSHASTHRKGMKRGLPVDFKKLKSIAVVGQDAKMPKKNCGELNECNEGTMSVGWGSGSNSLEYLIPPIDAITAEAEAQGSDTVVESSLSNDSGRAERVSKGKDVAFVFVNAMSGELGFYSVVVGNMGDRNDLLPWWWGRELIERVASVCSNTIVVVHSVGPITMPWSNHPNVTAIIYAGAPGEQTGPSIVDVLSGRYNPRGRLPFSIADDEKAYGTEIVYNSMGFPQVDYTERMWLDYRYMDANDMTPRFEFGFGLSYTKFEYSSLSVTRHWPIPGSSLSQKWSFNDTRPASTTPMFTLMFSIRNIGDVAGTEIPQVYIGYPEDAGEPKMVLRGFEEVEDLKPGWRSWVKVVLNYRDLSVWDVVTQKWVVPEGRFKVFVGASSRDVRLVDEFDV